MAELKMAVANGRSIPKEDKIFGINRRATEMAERVGAENVVNATIGALLDDNGKLMVLSSVDDTYRHLTPEEYASYAPIGGTPAFKLAAIKAALGNYEPKGFVRASATPGGTGAIRNTIANYSRPGDSVLTADWFWSPYGTIAGEIGRNVETFPFFTEDRQFHIKAFDAKMKDILTRQDSVVIIINTPAHNPTGYALTESDWNEIKESVSSVAPSKKVIMLVDAAYIDFAGDEDEYRQFLPILEELPENVLPLIAYSMSKTFTLYGMRCGALICMTPSEEIADEFVKVCEYSSRGTWSNCAKAGQSIIVKIFADDNLRNHVSHERKEIRDMLLRRGRAFEEAAEEAGLVTVPFDAGFFVSIPCDNPDAVSEKLEEDGIFVVPLAKGVRVSIASVPEAACRMIPAKIKAAIEG